MRSSISRTAFYIYDWLHGNELLKFYDEIKNRNESFLPFKDFEIAAFLECKGYIQEIEKNQLQSKDDIRQKLRFIDTRKVKKWAYTGGTYGEPLRIPYSQRRNLIRTATFKYFNEIGGYRLGDPFALIRAKDKNVILKFLRNESIFVPFDISERRIQEIITIIRKRGIRVLIGYPSVIYEIALCLKEHYEMRFSLPIKSVISVSEPLDFIRKQVISEVFDCTFIDRYSNEEVGLIAQQHHFGGPYYVNRHGVYVEIVDPCTLQPVREGVQGKVVVTDLFNDLIPIIRYDTGDLATPFEYRSGQLFSMIDIQGRVSEQIFSVSGHSVSPLALGPLIYKPLSFHSDLYQYQFAQTGKETYDLRIKARPEKVSLSLIKELRTNLMKVLGASAHIEIILLDDIKPLPSGKRPIYVNEVKA